MAIKIDLLPAYVKLKRTFHRVLAACVVALGVVVGGLLMALQQRQLELETAQTNLAAAKIVADQVAAAKRETDQATSDAAPLIATISFVTGASKTGAQRAALIDLIRRYIDVNAIVSAIDVSDGQKVVITATVRTPAEYARFLLNLRRASDTNGGTLFKGLPVTTKGPPGFANGAKPFELPLESGEIVPILYPVDVVAEGTLLNPVQLPPEPGGAAAAPATTPDP